MVVGNWVLTASVVLLAVTLGLVARRFVLGRVASLSAIGFLLVILGCLMATAGYLWREGSGVSWLAVAFIGFAPLGRHDGAPESHVHTSRPVAPAEPK